MKLAWVGLLFLSVLVFIPYFTHPTLDGYDSYAFLNLVCHHTYSHSPLNQIPGFDIVHNIQEFVFFSIPCDLFIIKVILLTCFIVFVMTTAKIGEYALGKRGVWSAYFLFMVPGNLLASFFWKFENDTFGMPIIAIGMAVITHAFYKADGKRRMLESLLGIVVMGIGSLMWGGGGVAILGAALLSPSLFIASWPLLGVVGKELFQGIGENPLILENHSFWGLASLSVLNLGFISPILAPMTLFIGIATFVSGKFSVLAAPLLSVSLLKSMNDYSLGKYLPVLITISVVFGLTASFVLLGQIHPGTNEWEAVEHAITVHQNTGKPIINEFWYGYLLDYEGYSSKFYGFYTPGWNQQYLGHIIISHETFPCPSTAFSDLNVYEC